MKIGSYLKDTWVAYVALPIIGLAMSISVNGQRYDGDIKHCSVPDMNGDGIPEVLTSVNNIYDGTNRLCLLKSGAGADYSEPGVFDDDILKTKILEDESGKFRGIGVKTSKRNGTYYLIDITDSGEFSQPRQVKAGEFRKAA